MLIAIDDTDSLKGNCTTYLATELIKEFSELNLIGFPKLVRLNPNIPWKTRGNGAICLKFGRGIGEKFLVGEIDGKKYFGYEREKKEFYNFNSIKERVQKIVEKYSHFEDELTNPAFVISEKKFSQKLYWKALREILTVNEVKKILNGKAIFKGYKNQRGLIGSASAISWMARRKTYEIIAYREKENIGKKREIDEKSVIKMDKNFKDTFNNYDYENKHVVIAPSSPCPVLFGIRSISPKNLIKAKNMIISEKIDRWLIYETNQGTDEHLQKKKIKKIKPYDSVIVKGKVIENSREIKGGHVVFRISDGEEIDCTVYEPAKKFRNVARGLKVGDEVLIYGSVREFPLTINVEKIKIEKLAEVFEKIENPICKCGKRMKSIGKNKGFRCLNCGKKTKYINVRKAKRNLQEKFYEPPTSARRHLSMPLKLFKWFK